MPEIVGRARPPRLAAAPASPALGELYYDTAFSTLYWWNGTIWVPARGASTASSLPASPFDGQEIFLQTAQMVTDNVCWHLRYRASLASNKWEFLGGAHMQSVVNTAETTASTAFADLATVGPQQTIDYAGIYDVTVEGWTNTAAVLSNGSYMTPVGPGLAAADQNACWAQSPSAGTAAAIGASVSKTTRCTFTAGGAVKAQYRSSATGAGTITWQRRSIIVRPVRIGG